MDVTKLIRDPSKVHAALKDVEDGSTIAVKPVKIYVPKRFLDKRLAVIGQEYRILAFYAMVVDDKYWAYSDAIGFLEIEPSNVNDVIIDEDTYLEFEFEVGDRVFKTTDMLVDDTMCYRVYDEFIAQGHTPWYMGAEEDAGIMDTASYHADANLQTNRAIFEMITSSRARDKNDRAKYYRHTVKSTTDFTTRPPELIQLRDVTYGASSTVAKMVGPYFKDTIASAVVTPSTRVEGIEQHLRN